MGEARRGWEAGSGSNAAERAVFCFFSYVVWEGRIGAVKYILMPIHVGNEIYSFSFLYLSRKELCTVKFNRI